MTLTRVLRPMILMLVLILTTVVQVFGQLPPPPPPPFPFSSHIPTDVDGDDKGDLVWHHATTGLVVA